MGDRARKHTLDALCKPVGDKVKDPTDAAGPLIVEYQPTATKHRTKERHGKEGKQVVRRTSLTIWACLVPKRQPVTKEVLTTEEEFMVKDLMLKDLVANLVAVED